jgi:hypothetical protein
MAQKTKSEIAAAIKSKMAPKGEAKSQWFAKRSGCPLWHKVEDIVDTKQGYNHYFLEGSPEPVPQSQIEDLKVAEALEKETPGDLIQKRMKQALDVKAKKAAEPPGVPTIDYSTFKKPLDSTTGKVKPIHQPFQHMTSKANTQRWGEPKIAEQLKKCLSKITKIEKTDPE